MIESGVEAPGGCTVLACKKLGPRNYSQGDNRAGVVFAQPLGRAAHRLPNTWRTVEGSRWNPCRVVVLMCMYAMPRRRENTGALSSLSYGDIDPVTGSRHRSTDHVTRSAT